MCQFCVQLQESIHEVRTSLFPILTYYLLVNNIPVRDLCHSFTSLVFQEDENSQCIIKGVKINAETFQNILDFCYHGKISLPLEEIKEFIDCGKALEIQGIFQDNEEKCDESEGIKLTFLPGWIECQLCDHKFENKFQNFIRKLLTLNKMQKIKINLIIVHDIC